MDSERFAREVLSWDPRERVSNLCSDLIKIPSENPPGDCQEIAAFIREQLERAGFLVRRIVGPSGQPSLVTELEFGDGPVLILNGHMDVVPPGDRARWSWDPFSGLQRDGYVLGRGASDMKGGLASLMVALEHVASSDIHGLAGRIIFMAVPDEETGGSNGTGFLLDKGIVGDACLIAEPSGTNPTIGQKGNLWLRLRTEGQPAHGSLSPLVGVNAILDMYKGIQAIYSLYEKRWLIPPREQELINRSQAILRAEGRDLPAEALGRVTVNVGKITGGEKVNIVADRCEAHFDLRVPIGVETSEVLREAVEQVNQVGLHNAFVKPYSTPNEPNYTPPEHPFVRLVSKVIKAVTRKDPSPVLQWASSDARFFRYKGIPTVQYGPCELEGIHSYDERVSVDDLVQAARVYALLMCEFLCKGPGHLKSS